MGHSPKRILVPFVRAKGTPPRRAVLTMPLQKAPRRRQATTNSPQKSFTTFHHRKVTPRRAGALIKPCKRPRQRRPQIRPAKKSPSNSGKALFVILVYACHSFTWRRSQSHQASTPSPVRAQMGKISSFGFLMRAYSVTLSISKSKYGSTSTLLMMSASQTVKISGYFRG